MNQNVLTNVNPIYQFQISAHGSNYWIQNVSTGSYIGGTTTLYAITQANSSYLPWTLSFSGGAVHLKNNRKGYDLNFSNGVFNLGSSNSNIRLWKAVALETTYYATNP